MQSTYWLEKVLKMISLYVNALMCTLQHIVIHTMQLSGVNSENWHRWIASRVWQYAAACTKLIDVQGDHFQHILLPVSTSHLHLFNFLYRVRDLRPRWSTRRRAGFSCANLYLHEISGYKYIGFSTSIFKTNDVYYREYFI